MGQEFDRDDSDSTAVDIVDLDERGSSPKALPGWNAPSDSFGLVRECRDIKMDTVNWSRHDILSYDQLECNYSYYRDYMLVGSPLIMTLNL